MALTMVRRVLPATSGGGSRRAGSGRMAVTLFACVLISGARRQFGAHQFTLLLQMPRHVGIDIVKQPVGGGFGIGFRLCRGIGQYLTSPLAQPVAAGLIERTTA